MDLLPGTIVGWTGAIIPEGWRFFAVVNGVQLIIKE
jgi:hypothetical protein